MTPAQRHDFAAKHAPALAAGATRLCGQVIVKSMTGILEEVCRIEQERNEAVAALKALVEQVESGTFDHIGADHPSSAVHAARIVIAKATGSA